MLPKVLHIMHVLPEKYNSRFIDFARKYLDKYRHVFFAHKKNKQADEPNINPFRSRIGSRLYLFRLLMRHGNFDVVVLHGFMHGFFDVLFYFFLFQITHLNQKLVWKIWGADIYTYKNRRQGPFENWEFIQKIAEGFKQKVFKNIKYASSLVEGDAAIAKKYYAPQAKIFKAFYPNPVPYGIVDNSPRTNDLPLIMVGNSGVQTNNHHEIFLALKNIRGEFKVYCPLAYGDRKYIAKVITSGIETFGENFLAQQEMSSPDEYSKVIGRISVAIFNHNRQQALGNILQLLYQGKKLYLRENVTTFQCLKSLSLPVYATESITGKKINRIEELLEQTASVSDNRNVIIKHFGDEQCKAKWIEMLDYIHSSQLPIKPRKNSTIQ